jgi:hypothetical protein
MMEVQMKSTLLLCVLFAATLFAPSLAATQNTIHEQLNGTWSGAWIPDGGVRDAMTIELRQDDSGKLTGKFLTPVSMDFSKATFNSKTHTLVVEASDAKSGKLYKLNAKVEGTEINGTVAADNQSGKVNLIKWTYVPRVGY